MDTNEQQTAGTVFADQDRELVNESRIMNDDVSSHNEKDCGDEQDALGVTANDLGGSLINQMAGENGICDDPTKEEISYTNTDVVSGDGFSKNDEKVLISDAEISGNAYSKEAAFTDRNEAEEIVSNKDSHKDLMDVEPLTINTPSSTMEFQEQCTLSPQNETNGLDTDLLVLSNKVDSNSISNKASPSKSVSLESKAISVAETSGGVYESENELESENASGAKSPISTDNVVALDENCEDSMNDSTILHDVELVQRIKSLNSESSRNHPSVLWLLDLVGVAALETDSCKEPSINKPSITRCELKSRAEKGDCENGIILTQKGKTDVMGIQLDVVSSCNSTAAD